MIVEPVIVEPVATPVVAVRYARVRLTPGGSLAFCGLSHLGWTAREATAECRAGHGHEVPDFDCACGLWACPDEDALVSAAWGLPRGLRCRVTMWGRIVEHERGWRAAHLRYDAVELPRRCHALGCDAPFDHLHQDDACGLVGWCAGHAPSGAVLASVVEAVSDVRVVAADDVAAAVPDPFYANGCDVTGGPSVPRVVNPALCRRLLVAAGTGVAAMCGAVIATSVHAMRSTSVTGSIDQPSVVPSILVIGAFMLLLVHRVVAERVDAVGALSRSGRIAGIVLTVLVALATISLGVGEAHQLSGAPAAPADDPMLVPPIVMVGP